MITNTQRIAISKLTSAPYNPRKINKAEFEKLKNSIKDDSDFLNLRPVIANKREGKLIVFAGNQRLAAARALGWKDIPCIVVQVTPAKEKEWNLKDNNNAGDFVHKLIAENFDATILENVGFKQSDLDAVNKILNNGGAVILPDVKFTEELNEEHNYVVLYFKNNIDWLWFESLIKLPTVKALGSKVGFEKKGVGRVLDGVKTLRELLKK